MNLSISPSDVQNPYESNNQTNNQSNKQSINLSTSSTNQNDSPLSPILHWVEHSMQQPSQYSFLSNSNQQTNKPLNNQQGMNNHTVMAHPIQPLYSSQPIQALNQTMHHVGSPPINQSMNQPTNPSISTGSPVMASLVGSPSQFAMSHPVDSQSLVQPSGQAMTQPLSSDHWINQLSPHHQSILLANGHAFLVQPIQLVGNTNTAKTSPYVVLLGAQSGQSIVFQSPTSQTSSSSLQSNNQSVSTTPVLSSHFPPMSPFSARPIMLQNGQYVDMSNLQLNSQMQPINQSMGTLGSPNHTSVNALQNQQGFSSTFSMPVTYAKAEASMLMSPTPNDYRAASAAGNVGTVMSPSPVSSIKNNQSSSSLMKVPLSRKRSRGASLPDVMRLEAERKDRRDSDASASSIDDANDSNGGSDRVDGVSSSRLLKNVSKKPSFVLRFTAPRSQLPNHLNALETATGVTSDTDSITVNLRILGGPTLEALYFVAADLSQLIHSRKSNIAKAVSSFKDDERARAPVLCPRSNQTASTHILTVLTWSGVTRLLSSSRANVASQLLSFIQQSIPAILTHIRQSAEQPAA